MCVLRTSLVRGRGGRFPRVRGRHVLLPVMRAQESAERAPIAERLRGVRRVYVRVRAVHDPIQVAMLVRRAENQIAERVDVVRPRLEEIFQVPRVLDDVRVRRE